MTAPTTVIVVADGCGVGAQHDAATFATSAANTLTHALAAGGGATMPTLRRWGIDALIAGRRTPTHPDAYLAAAAMTSAGCDTPAGHWELLGRVTAVAAATYPDGFDDTLIAELCAAWDVDDVLANCVTGGLDALDRWGADMVAAGHPIVYTSADSVLQIAAHVDHVALDRLYRWCEQARTICDDRWPIGRIIARPYTGQPGAWERLGSQRRDWGTPPPADGGLDRLAGAGVTTVGIGKIGDIFDHRSLTSEVHPDGLDALCAATVDTAADLRSSGGGVVLVNLVEFDYRGHARDAAGFCATLDTLDTLCADLEGILEVGDRIVVTADHGNDPTHTVDDHGHPHVDHTREHVPLIVRRVGHPGAIDTQLRHMADLGASVCTWHGVDAAGLDGTPLPT